MKPGRSRTDPRKNVEQRRQTENRVKNPLSEPRHERGEARRSKNSRHKDKIPSIEGTDRPEERISQGRWKGLRERENTPWTSK